VLAGRHPVHLVGSLSENHLSSNVVPNVIISSIMGWLQPDSMR